VGEPAARLLEAQVDRDREAAHIADLKVEHYEIGMVLGYRTAYVLAPDHLDDFLAGRDDRGPDLVAHPARVSGDKEFHSGGTYPAEADGCASPGTDERDERPD
jgi:hypothetical protein